MTFEDFKERIMELVECKMGPGYKVISNEVIKNNGIKITGLTITHKDSNISPTIYINELYNLYNHGHKTLSEISDHIIEVYRKNRNASFNEDMRFFLDFDNVESKVIAKLVNREKNNELLSDVPHINKLDLAIIFQVLLESSDIGNATILIHNRHMKIWGISIDDLCAAANRNDERLMPCKIESMDSVLREISDINVDELPDSIPMYILSNKQRTNGAIGMFYPGLLRRFAESANTDLYILPSSLHEVIILPKIGWEDVSGLKTMVKEVNATQVDPEDVLSDSVYYYNREKDELLVM